MCGLLGVFEGGEALLVEVGDAINGFVAGCIDDGCVDGGGAYVAVTEEFGHGVEVGTSDECHGGVGVSCRVEGDVFIDSCVMCPRGDVPFNGGDGGERKDEVVGLSRGVWEPVDCFFVEFVVDGVECFLHDDGTSPCPVDLFDVVPFECSDIAEP